MSVDLEQLRGFISAMYSDVARYPRGDFHFPTGRPIMEKLGYSPELLDRIPSTSLESFAGVGHHFELEPISSGERVLDLGCGAGSDVFHAALQAGETGQTTGIDMTEQMLDKCHESLAQFEQDNVNFVQGFIEKLPFDAETFDCIISNGVINLTPSKATVFDEVQRVLKPGGRLMFSDIVTGVQLPESVRENCELWAECIGGAEEQNDYTSLIKRAGLNIERVQDNDYRFSEGSTLNAATKFKVKSISILAYKSP